MFEMFPGFGGRVKAQVNHSSALKCSKFSGTEPWDRNTTRQHFSISQLFFRQMQHFRKVFMKQSLPIFLLRFLSFCNAACQETNRETTTGCHHVYSHLSIFTRRQQPTQRYSIKYIFTLRNVKTENWSIWMTTSYLFCYYTQLPPMPYFDVVVVNNMAQSAFPSKQSKECWADKNLGNFIPFSKCKLAKLIRPFCSLRSCENLVNLHSS